MSLLYFVSPAKNSNNTRFLGNCYSNSSWDEGDSEVWNRKIGVVAFFRSSGVFCVEPISSLLVVEDQKIDTGRWGGKLESVDSFASPKIFLFRFVLGVIENLKLGVNATSYLAGRKYYIKGVV
ncbi:hypothetical protein MLD52_13875 [Puniceicoccaceae bacterium K14]|nr:hypothetical protein [Puniceicoccaceae bacterium K14]